MSSAPVNALAPLNTLLQPGQVQSMRNAIHHRVIPGRDGNSVAAEGVNGGPDHLNRGRVGGVLISVRTYLIDTSRRLVSMRNYVIDTSRGLAAAGVLLAAVVHLDLWVQGFRSVATIGALFLLDFIAGLVIGVGVLVWRHWLPALAAAGFGAATVIAFWISVIHGLFGVKETATGSSEILAAIAEYSAVAFGLTAVATLLLQRRSKTHPPVRPARTHSRPTFTMHKTQRG
jgi:hypothetical protein